MTNLYTTPQVSDLTGIPEGTLRSWLSRYPGVFLENTHVIIEDTGRKLWTDAGIELLEQRRDASKNATCNEETAAKNDATALDDVLDDVLDPLLDATVEPLVKRFFEQLPLRVIARVRQMLVEPTDLDRQLVRTSLHQAINQGAMHVLLPNTDTKRLL